MSERINAHHKPLTIGMLTSTLDVGLPCSGRRVACYPTNPSLLRAVIHFLISMSFPQLSTIHLNQLPLKTHGSPQHFHRVSANTNVRDTLAVARCSHIHFARTTNLDSLSNHYLFVAVCDPCCTIQLAAQPAADPVAGSSPP